MTFSKKQLIKWVLIGLGILLFIVLLVYGLNLYQRLKTPRSPVLSAIPSTVGLIIEINDPLPFNNKMRTEAQLWEGLSPIEPFKSLDSQLATLDSLVRLNENARNLFTENPLFISAHPSGTDEVQFMLLTETSVMHRISFVENILKSLFEDETLLSRQSFGGVDIIAFASETETYYFSIYRGVLMGSAHLSLLEDAIFRIKDGSELNQSESFAKIEATLGKRVDGNVYINYQNIFRIIHVLTADAYKPYLSFISDFAGWSGLDINLKNGALILNGFTDASPVDNSYLQLFSEQSPQRIEVTQLLPYNTPSFIFWGFSDFENFNNNLLKLKERQGHLGAYKDEMKSFENAIDLCPDKYLVRNICSEIAYAAIQGGSDSDAGFLLAIKFKDEEKLKQMLATINEKSKATLLGGVEVNNYRDFELGHFNYPDIFNTVLGTSFNLSRMDIYCVVGNYLVLGDSRDALVNVINAYLFKRNLANSTSYNNFSNLISASANIHLFFNISQSVQRLQSYLRADIAAEVPAYVNALAHFDGLAYQVSQSHDKFYTNICVNYSSELAEDETHSMWEVELGYPATYMINAVHNHNDNSTEIIVTDNNHNLYLIDKNGFTLWKRNIGEPILGDVHQIDYYKNGKLQYLFNTANTIHLIDRNGNDVADYPTRLPFRATNPLAVFDYSNDHNYRLFIANDNNEVVNLDKDANPVQGWNVFKTNHAVEIPVQYIRLLGKDFLLITDKKGEYHILNRRGEVRVSPDAHKVRAPNSPFYTLIGPNRKGMFVTTNKNGQIIKIDFEGKTEIIELVPFSENHYFVFGDFNNNSQNEYIFIDANRVIVYDYFKNIIAEHALSGTVRLNPQTYSENMKHVLSLFTDQAKAIYVLTNNYEIADDFPTSATTPGVIIETQEGVQSFIIAAEGKIVFKSFLD